MKKKFVVRKHTIGETCSFDYFENLEPRQTAYDSPIVCWFPVPDECTLDQAIRYYKNTIEPKMPQKQEEPKILLDRKT